MVVGVTLLVFFLIHLIPGDPAVLILGESAQPADLAHLRHELGLDQSIGRQLVQFADGLIHLDLGNSLHRRKAVTDILAEKFPATFELTLVSLCVALLIAFPLGILSAVRSHTIIDSGSMFFALLGVSIPNFWLGPMLILFFSVYLDILPVSGRCGWSSYILPAITLGTSLAAILTRMIRSSLLDVLYMPYITTAYSKGLSAAKVILKHALKNALIPVVTIIGLQFGALLGGSIITETVFSWPGIGREIIEAINGRDYPVVQGGVLVIALLYVVINILTDLLYAFLDPRIQFESSSAHISIQQRFEMTVKWIRSHFLRFILITGGVFFCGGVITAVFVPSGNVGGKRLLHALSRCYQGILSAMNSDTGIYIFSALFAGVVIQLLIQWRRWDIRSWRRFITRPAALIGFIITTVFFILGVFGPKLAPQDPTQQNLEIRLNPPGNGHLLGTDEMGRDVFSRILDGTRVSAKVGLTVTLVSVILGTLIGMISGVVGGWMDEIIMRIVDILLAFPGILLAIALVAVLGPNINNVILALCLMGWVGYARLARAQALTIREEDYISAAKALGASLPRIIFSHVLPNALAPIIVQATLGMAGVIIAEAGLSFLGLGVQPPTPSWGGILNSGVDYFRVGPHLTIFPGLAIMIVVLGMNFLGDGLRDALDPK